MCSLVLVDHKDLPSGCDQSVIRISFCGRRKNFAELFRCWMIDNDRLITGLAPGLGKVYESIEYDHPWKNGPKVPTIHCLKKHV